MVSLEMPLLYGQVVNATLQCQVGNATVECQIGNATVQWSGWKCHCSKVRLEMPLFNVRLEMPLFNGQINLQRQLTSNVHYILQKSVSQFYASANYSSHHIKE